MVRDKMPTSYIVDFTRELYGKTNQILVSIDDFIISNINSIENQIKDKIESLWRLRRNKEINKMTLRQAQQVSFEKIKQTIENLENICKY